MPVLDATFIGPGFTMTGKIYLPEIWGGPIVPPGGPPVQPPGGGVPPDYKPEHPIVIPPGSIDEGPPPIPAHPIWIPVYPAHPIVIPPGSIDPGPPPKPEHPIVLPPYYPAHPIVIPPGSVDPGPPPIPAHPIVIPDPLPPFYPAHPIVLPDPPVTPPSDPPSDNWQWGWNVSQGWHPVYVPGDKPQPVPPPPG